MPRLFTGLEIPSDLASDLGMLRGGISGARWIDTDRYHLTLRFIGDIDYATARDVCGTLEQIRRPAFTVTLEGLDFLRRRQAPRDHRQSEAGRAARRASGRAGTAYAAHRHSARAAQIHPAHHARAAARRLQRGRRRLSDDARFLLAPLRGDTVCFVFGALCHRRRALSGRGGLSAGVNLAKTARRIISFRGAAT